MTLRYALIVMTYWIGFATISAFSSLYLLDLGVSNTMIGALLAISALVSAFLQPLLTTYAERPDSPSLRRITCFIALLVAAVALLTLWTRTFSLALCAALYALTNMLLHTLQPMVNALGMETMNRGERLNFGLSRAGGSVGYAAVSYTVGYLAARFSPRIIPVLGALFFCVFALATALYPHQRQVRPVPGARIDAGMGAIAFFKKYPRFGLVLIGCTLMFTSHSLVNTYNLQIIMTKGGGSVEMGTATAIAACIEIPGMILFAAFSKRFRCDTLLEASGVFFLLKCLGSLVAPTVALYYAVQIFQLFGWGLFAVASVRYTNRVMAPEDTIKGQGYTTVVQSLGSVLGTTVGGRMMDVLGVQAMLVFGIVVAAFGTMVVTLSAEKVRV